MTSAIEGHHMPLTGAGHVIGNLGPILLNRNQRNLL
jgi:hypothetical protein